MFTHVHLKLTAADADENVKEMYGKMLLSSENHRDERGALMLLLAL